MNLLELFWMILKSSTLSTGGFGNVPMIHSEVVGGHILSEKTFAESLAVGQISPGPNGLWVVSLGYMLHGWAGASLSTLAILIPPTVVVLVERAYFGIKDHPAVVGFMRGLTLAVTGIFALVMLRLLSQYSRDIFAITIAAVAFGLGISRRVPVIVIILGAATIGMLAG